MTDRAPSPVRATPWSHLFVRVDHAPREKFSASGLSTASDCMRAWGYRYLVGLKTKEPDHRDYDRLNPRDKALAFGKALHARLEAYFRGEAVVWTDDIGQRALVGLHLLPQAPPVRVEEQISVRLDTSYEPILFDGYKDLSSPIILYDYKTTGNFRWMKSPADLRKDPAAAIYACDEMIKAGPSRAEQQCRWVYFARNDRPKAEPVDFTITRSEAHSIVSAMSLDAANLRSTMRAWDGNGVDHLPVNVGNCRKYNGCPYHVSTGGPCQAEATPGVALVQIDLSRIHEPNHAGTPAETTENTMATIAERLAAAAAAQKAPQAAPTAPVQTSPFPPVGASPAVPAFAVTQFAPPPAAPLAAPAPFPPVAAAPAAPPAPPPTAPLPPFAGFPTQPGFGAPPVFAGVNPPEQHTAAPLPPMPDPALQAPPTEPAKQRKPRGPNKPKGTPTPGAAPSTDAGLCDVTITITHDNGASITIPAPAEIAEQFAAVLGETLAGMA